jgi:5-methylcytosine-specific restriction endonuclease McrA
MAHTSRTVIPGRRYGYFCVIGPMRHARAIGQWKCFGLSDRSLANGTPRQLSVDSETLLEKRYDSANFGCIACLVGAWHISEVARNVKHNPIKKGDKNRFVCNCVCGSKASFSRIQLDQMSYEIHFRRMHSPRPSRDPLPLEDAAKLQAWIKEDRKLWRAQPLAELSLSLSCGCISDDEVIQSFLDEYWANYHVIGKSHLSIIARKKQQRNRLINCGWTNEMELALRSFQLSCVVCGRKKNLHTDHVHPASTGSGLKPGNAVRLCRHCNAKKSAKKLTELPKEMRDYIVKANRQFKNHWQKTHKTSQFTQGFLFP